MVNSDNSGRALPAGWTESSLAQLIPKTRGKIKPSKATNLPFIGMDHIEANGFALIGQAKFSEMKSAASHFMPGDVLYGRLRPYLNKVHAAKFEGASSAEFIVLPQSDTHNTDFLKYLLHQRRFVEFASANSNGDRPRVDFETIGKFKFNLPPLGEQGRIASKIDELFSRIDAGEAALKRAKALVERYRKSILKAAVTGELTREWREKNKDKIEPADQLLKRILKTRREAWETAELAKMKAKGKTPKNDAWKKKYTEPAMPDASELPELPEGWVWISWAQAGWSQNGRPFPSSKYSDTGTKLLRPGNLFADGTVKWIEKNTQCLPPSFEIENPDLHVGAGELVINLTAQSLKDEFLGRVCLTGEYEHCLLNQRLARLTPILIEPAYMLAVFKSAIFRDFVANLNTGSLIQHMFTSQMEAFVFPLPPITEQARIATQIQRHQSSMAALLETCNNSTRQSALLKNAVLQKAFQGELVIQAKDDQPASTLLERIRNDSSLAITKKRTRSR